MAHLLIIDDDLGFRALLNDYFSDLGYQVTLSEGGSDGLSLAKKLKPDVILLDAMMPNISGIEVLRSMQADEDLRFIPALIITGSHFETTVRDLFMSEINCKGFFSKAIPLNTIAEELKKILKGKI